MHWYETVSCCNVSLVKLPLQLGHEWVITHKNDDSITHAYYNRNLSLLNETTELQVHLQQDASKRWVYL